MMAIEDRERFSAESPSTVIGIIIMRAVLLTNDLMVTSVAHGAAQRCGAALELASNAAQLLAAIERGSVGLVVIDIRIPNLDVESMLERIRSVVPSDSKVVAFGPHVHVDALAAATAAGCNEVITRGEFDRKINGYLVAVGCMPDNS